MNAYVLQEETGATPAEIVRAYTIAWETFNLRKLWTMVTGLAHNIPGAVRTQIMLEGSELIYRTSKWLLRNRRRGLPVAVAIDAYTAGAKALESMLPRIFEKSQDENIRASIQGYLDNGLDKGLALRVATMDAFYSTFDIVEISNTLKREIGAVAEVYFRLSGYLNLFWLRAQIENLTADNRWQHRANVAMFDDLYDLLSELTKEVLKSVGRSKRDATGSAAQCIEKWHAANKIAVDRYLQLIEDLKWVDTLDHAMISVTLREMQNMLRAVET